MNMQLQRQAGYSFVQIVTAIAALAMMGWISFFMQRITHWPFLLNFGGVLAIVFLALRLFEKPPLSPTDHRLEQTLHHAIPLPGSVEAMLQQISSVAELPDQLDLFVPVNLTLGGAPIRINDAVAHITTRLKAKGYDSRGVDQQSDGRLCHFVRNR